MSILPPNFPLAPDVYSRDEERAFRARVADAIGDRLGKFEVPQFGGVPHGAVKGSNAAFSTPGSGVVTLLPFDDIIKFNPDLMTGANFNFKYAMNVLFSVRLQQTGGAGGNTSFSFIVKRNAVPVLTLTDDIALGDDRVFLRTLFAPITAVGETYTFSVSHSSSQAMVFNMQLSSTFAEQLTPNPRLVGLERL